MAIDVTRSKAIRGKDIFYFIQSVDAPIGSNAKLPAFRTDGSTTLGGEYIDEQTQQGRIIEKSTDEHAVSLTQYFAPADESVQIIEEAQASGKSVKVWEVIAHDSVKEGTGAESTYPAKFGFGKVGEIEYGGSTTDLVELSYDLNVIGSLQKGRFPLTDEDLALLREFYAYQNPGETTGDYDEITDAEGV